METIPHFLYDINKNKSNENVRCERPKKTCFLFICCCLCQFYNPLPHHNAKITLPKMILSSFFSSHSLRLVTFSIPIVRMSKYRKTLNQLFPISRRNVLFFCCLFSYIFLYVVFYIPKKMYRIMIREMKMNEKPATELHSLRLNRIECMGDLSSERELLFILLQKYISSELHLFSVFQFYGSSLPYKCLFTIQCFFWVLCVARVGNAPSKSKSSA